MLALVTRAEKDTRRISELFFTRKLNVLNVPLFSVSYHKNVKINLLNINEPNKFSLHEAIKHKATSSVLLLRTLYGAKFLRPIALTKDHGGYTALEYAK